MVLQPTGKGYIKRLTGILIAANENQARQNHLFTQ
jgi:hypothetical protein